MHELAVTQSMVNLVLEEARKGNALKVKKINLVLGELTGIVDQCVTFYWDMLAKDTIASSAEIGFRKVPVVARCTSCGKEFTPSELDLTCPACGANHAELVSGREFQVESIEIECRSTCAEPYR